MLRITISSDIRGGGVTTLGRALHELLLAHGVDNEFRDDAPPSRERTRGSRLYSSEELELPLITIVAAELTDSGEPEDEKTKTRREELLEKLREIPGSL